MKAARIHAYRQPLVLDELREVIALVEDGHLALGHAETASLDQINEVYARPEQGDVDDRVNMTP